MLSSPSSLASASSSSSSSSLSSASASESALVGFKSSVSSISSLFVASATVNSCASVSVSIHERFFFSESSTSSKLNSAPHSVTSFALARLLFAPAGGRVQKAILPLFQSCKISLAALFVSKMPPFVTFPLFFATNARHSFVSEGRGMAYAAMIGSGPHRSRMTSTGRTGSSKFSIFTQFLNTSALLCLLEKTTPGESNRRIFLSNCTS
mmetsp:Transcript_682/g.2269  ORF Transcript_682/g.2269 Transcript_682/m.2269 type:complete len:209 (-) Transcript_682:957-1583(-)